MLKLRSARIKGRSTCSMNTPLDALKLPFGLLSITIVDYFGFDRIAWEII